MLVVILLFVGNHEEKLRTEHKEAWEHYLQQLQNNIHFLNNEGQYVLEKRNIFVSGLALPKIFYKTGSLYTNEEQLPKFFIPKDCFHIMLAHNPEYAKLYGAYKAGRCLQVCGQAFRLPRQ